MISPKVAASELGPKLSRAQIIARPVGQAAQAPSQIKRSGQGCGGQCCGRRASRKAVGVNDGCSTWAQAGDGSQDAHECGWFGLGARSVSKEK